MALEAHSTVVDRLNAAARDLERMSREHVFLDDKTLKRVARY